MPTVRELNSAECQSLISASVRVITALHDNILAPYSLRVTQPKLCDPSVKQLSGYFDVGKGKNLFFWSVLALL